MENLNVKCYNDTCPICLDGFDNTNITNNTTILSCRHGFHADCAKLYCTDLLTKKIDIICPLCNTIILKATSETYNLYYTDFTNSEITLEDNIGVVLYNQSNTINNIIRYQYTEKQILIFILLFWTIIALFVIIGLGIMNRLV